MNTIEAYIPIAVVLALYIARTLEVGTKRDVIRGPVKENLSFILFIVTGVVMLLGGIVEYVLRGGRPSWSFVVVGLLVAICSIVLRRRAIQALGKFWSLHVEIRDEHQFVQSGPFRWVRHPTYFSMILELLSIALILRAWIMGVVVFLFFIPALLYRLRLEEPALIEKFGDAYRDYRRQVPALFPYKLPRKP